MAKKGKKKGGRRRPKPSIIMLFSIGAAIIGSYTHIKGGGSGVDKAGRALECVIGINPFAGTPRFQWQKMFFTLPVGGGIVAKKGMNYLGAGRFFRGLPFTA